MKSDEEIKEEIKNCEDELRKLQEIRSPRDSDERRIQVLIVRISKITQRIKGRQEEREKKKKQAEWLKKELKNIQSSKHYEMVDLNEIYERIDKAFEDVSKK